MDEDESPDNPPSKHADIADFQRIVSARSDAVSAAGIATRASPEILSELLAGEASDNGGGMHYPFRTLKSCMQHVLLENTSTVACTKDASMLRCRLILHYVWDADWQGNWKVCWEVHAIATQTLDHLIMVPTNHAVLGCFDISNIITVTLTHGMMHCCSLTHVIELLGIAVALVIALLVGVVNRQIDSRTPSKSCPFGCVD
jgi:hypothetical protein